MNVDTESVSQRATMDDVLSTDSSSFPSSIEPGKLKSFDISQKLIDQVPSAFVQRHRILRIPDLEGDKSEEIRGN